MRPLVVLALLALLGSGCARHGCGSQFTFCKSNLKNFGTALEMYSTDAQGRYPTSLARLSPNYLKTIPTCPIAGRDTYSQTYVSGVRPDRYALYCSGDAHHRARADLPVNLPAYDSQNGLHDGQYPEPHNLTACRERVIQVGQSLQAYAALHGRALPKNFQESGVLLVTDGPKGSWRVCCDGANHLADGVAPFQPQWDPGRGLSERRLPGYSPPVAPSDFAWQALLATAALVAGLLYLSGRRVR